MVNFIRDLFSNTLSKFGKYGLDIISLEVTIMLSCCIVLISAILQLFIKDRRICDIISNISIFILLGCGFFSSTIALLSFCI